MASQFLDVGVAPAGFCWGRTGTSHKREWGRSTGKMVLDGLGLGSTGGLAGAALNAHLGAGLKLVCLSLLSSSSCHFPYARCIQTQPMGAIQLEELLDGYGIIMRCSLVIPNISTCLKTRHSIFRLCKEYPQIFLVSIGPPQCMCV